LSVAIGRRALLEWVHVIAGIMLPVPFLVGWCSRRFRADVRRLNRFLPEDWEWLRSRDRRSGRIPVGKFNAGQKLNAAFTLGAILVMLGTGSIMRFANHWPVQLRTGATFVHDWLSLTILVVVLGHLWFAMRDPVARAGMRTGHVPPEWAAVEHAGWLAEVTAAGGAAGTAGAAEAAAQAEPPTNADQTPGR
jgi:formate dehydrogenase subunit gamma